MENSSVTVAISRAGIDLKKFQESYEGSLSSFIDALKKIKSSTNEYLTELVNEEKGLLKERGSTQNSVPEKPEGEESDVELEEDFIDSEIKKLSENQDDVISDKKNENGKRTMSRSRQNKRMRH